MRAFVAAIAVVLGCGNDDAPGVLIEVRGEEDAMRYELLLSLEPCDACTSIAPPSAADSIAGTGWLSRDLQRFAVDHDEPSKRARFQLQTDIPDGMVVKRAVIVALAGDTRIDREIVLGIATLGPFEVPFGESVKFEVDLRTADPLGTDSDNEHAELWRRANDPDHTACVVVQHGDGSAEFFVPSDDTDCDDTLLAGTAECNEFGYLSSGSPSLADATCFTHDDAFCRIGGPPCYEGAQPVPPNLVCAPVAPSYCMPEHLCTNTCTSFDPTCFGVVDGVPSAICEVYTEGGRPCGAAGSATRLSMQSIVMDAGGGCRSIEIATFSRPLGFGTTVVVGDQAPATFTIDPGTFDPLTCAIDVTWSGYLPYSDGALVKVVTNNDVIRVVPWRLKVASSYCPTTGGLRCYSEPGLLSNTFYACR